MTQEQQKEQKVTLYMQEGSSDKVYQLHLKPEQSGWMIYYANARRGGALNPKPKTTKALPYEEALKTYEKIRREKESKGYTPDESGTPYQYTTEEARVTGVSCQLLNPIERKEVVALLNDPVFWMQEKFDGERRPVKRKDGKAIGINRKGLAVGIPQDCADFLENLHTDFIIDSEEVNQVLHVFDLLELDNEDIKHPPYEQRLEKLEELINEGCKCVQVVKTAKTQKEKEKLLEEIEKNNKEGVVFKNSKAHYSAGRPASGGNQLKLKFKASASVIVSGKNTKRSVAMKVLNDKGREIEVGNVSVPTNYALPEEGSIVEIQYLYAYPNGCLFQPVYKGERKDIEKKECLISQLKYKV